MTIYSDELIFNEDSLEISFNNQMEMNMFDFKNIFYIDSLSLLNLYVKNDNGLKINGNTGQFHYYNLIEGLTTKRDDTSIVLEKLYQNVPKSELLVGLLRQLVRSGRNIAITGEMASGKTTLFRACLAETRKDLNIRVIEADSFELNVRGFLPKSGRGRHLFLQW